MIITRTPNRISLLGGGSDYKNWSTKNGGICVGGAITKYSYISARCLYPFHTYKHRICYKETELVNSVEEIQHAAVKSVLKHVKWADKGIEIVHMSDLPARSGTGSSSTFTVGLLNAVSCLLDKRRLPNQLAYEAIHIEQNLLAETVGCQDQIFAAIGGLNILRFKTNGEFSAIPFSFRESHLCELEQVLMLFHTNMPRTSSEIAKTYVPTLNEQESAMWSLVRLAEDSVDVIYRKDWEKLGNLIEQSWKIKIGLSPAVTNEKINQMYAAARIAGAFGGKLCGAGGGGSFLFVVPIEKQERVKAALSNFQCVHVPFQFDDGGSQVIFSERK